MTLQTDVTPDAGPLIWFLDSNFDLLTIHASLITLIVTGSSATQLWFLPSSFYLFSLCGFRISLLSEFGIDLRALSVPVSHGHVLGYIRAHILVIVSLRVCSEPQQT